MFDSDNADERQSDRGVTVVDAFFDGGQGGNCYFVEPFTGCGEALPATPIPFGNEGDVLVAPCSHSGALDPSLLGRLTMCSAPDERVDGD